MKMMLFLPVVDEIKRQINIKVALNFIDLLIVTLKGISGKHYSY